IRGRQKSMAALLRKLAHASASPVSGVAIRAQQQGNVELRFAVAHAKSYLEHWIQCLGFLRGIVAFHIECQPVKSLEEFFSFRKYVAGAPVGVGMGGGQ